MLVKKHQWTGGDGEDYVFAFTDDGTYLYVALCTNPSQVVKINVSTMTQSAKWTGTDTLAAARALYHDGTHLYAGGALTSDTTRGRVTKIDTSDMSTVSSWDAPDAADANQVTGITGDGSYIYASLDTGPAEGEYVVAKIDPSDMSLDSSYDGGGTHEECHGIVHVSGYLYVPCQTGNSVIKITASNMSLNDSYSAGATVAYYSIATDNTYVYAGEFNVAGADGIRKIDISDMSSADFLELDSALSANSLSYASPNVHALIKAKVYAIVASGLDEESVWLPDNTASTKYGVYDFGGYTYVGEYTDPGVVHKLLDGDVTGPFPTHFRT